MTYHGIVTDDDIKYFKSLTNDEIKKMIAHYGSISYEFLKFPKGNLDDLLQEIRDEGFNNFVRIGNWHSCFAKVLNYDGIVKRIKAYEVTFRYINKWKQKSPSVKITIMINDNSKIIWLGIKNKLNKNYISYNDNIYQFSYSHKKLELLKTELPHDIYFNKEDLDCNIDIIRKHYNSNKLIEIDLNDCFEKGFFYKGPKWTSDWRKEKYPNDITRLTKISVKNNYFYLEIENITYPFKGWCLLDLEEMKIIEAKKDDTIYQ